MSRPHWVVEIYTFPNSDPQVETSGDEAISLYTTATDQESKSYITNAIQKQTGITPSLSKGIRSLEFGRSKYSPDGTAVITFQGTIEKDVYPGAWVLISSFSKNGDNKGILTRFFGQIYEISPQYLTTPSGLITSQVTVNIREWSSSLNMPVRYDLYSIYRNELQKANGLPFASSAINANFSQLKKIPGIGGESVSPNQLIEILSKSYNPFEFAHLALALIGSISDNDKVNSIKALGDLKYPEVALTMPSVPKSVLKRIGAPASANGKNPFSTGAVEVITGIQTKALYNDGTWNGIFKETNISSFKDDFFNKNPEDRPKASGLSNLIQTGTPAWTILSNYCDPELNEVFSDIWYTKEGDFIIAKPVIVVRDKPFLMNFEKKISESEDATYPLNNWSLYDNLPRLRIRQDHILAFNLKNTFMGAPNLFRVNFYDHQDKNNIPNTWLHTQGFLPPIIPTRERFGGLEYDIKTSFVGINPNIFNQEKWFGVVSRWAKAIHANTYKLSNGVLAIKDYNFPVALGLNIQFQIGKFDLVGHVSAIRTFVTVMENGVVDTNTQINLDRIVQTGKNGKDLTYIDTAQLTKLLQATPNYNNSNQIVNQALAPINKFVKGLF